MIEMSFDQSDERVIFWLQEGGKSILREILREMKVQMQTLNDVVVEDKLSGQVLRTRTGTLRRAQHNSVEGTDAEIVGKVATDPSASKYGIVHEYGGTFGVRAHLRRSSRSLYTSMVRAHSATYPERSYLRSSLRERTTAIVAGLREAAARGVAEANG